MSPLGPNPWWTAVVAIVPALLCTILIFMDQQITAVIINRKEHKLKVGPDRSGPVQTTGHQSRGSLVSAGPQ